MVSEGRKPKIRRHIWLGEFENGELNKIKKLELCRLAEEKQQNLECIR
jgi:hypothetical protein